VGYNNLAETQTCEVGSRLYDLFFQQTDCLGKFQTDAFARIQGILTQAVLILLAENPALSCSCATRMWRRDKLFSVNFLLRHTDTLVKVEVSP